MKQLLAASLTMFSLLLSACATVRGGPSVIMETEDPRLGSIRQAMTQACLNLPSWNGTLVRASAGDGSDEGDENDNPPTVTTAMRNELALAYMLAANEVYDSFESGMVNDGRVLGFVATITSLGLATAGAAAGGHTAKVLSAANTGVIGERAAYTKEFLFDQTITALQNQMQARRTKVRARIYQSLAKPMDEWPVCMALQDLREYEQAGTLASALQNLNETAAAARAGEEKQIERVRFAADGLAAALRSYMAPEGAADAVLTARSTLVLNQALAASKLTVPSGMSAAEYVSRLSSDQGLDAERRKLILGILKVERDEAARSALIDALNS